MPRTTYLYDWVLVGLGEDALASSALDVKTENAERRHLRPLALRCIGDEVLPRDVNLDLASCFLHAGFPDFE